MTEYHLPGYNFCGPGTEVEKRLARGDTPINELDACCLVHDLVYHDTTDTKQRVASDRVLRKCADAIMQHALANQDMQLYAEASIVSAAMGTEPGRWI